MTKKPLVIAYIGLLIIGFYYAYDEYRVIDHPPGVLAEANPTQLNLDAAEPFLHNGYTFTPMANFSVEARVLSREKYNFGYESNISPVDFALGWGPMSDTAVIEKLNISQGGRFYSWHVDDIRDLPIPLKEIITHSSNMHMIPADSRIEKKLAAVREGHVIAITGQLVKVNGENGYTWRSSMTRTDTGKGACELVYVKDVQIL